MTDEQFESLNNKGLIENDGDEERYDDLFSQIDDVCEEIGETIDEIRGAYETAIAVPTREDVDDLNKAYGDLCLVWRRCYEPDEAKSDDEGNEEENEA